MPAVLVLPVPVAGSARAPTVGAATVDVATDVAAGAAVALESAAVLVVDPFVAAVSFTLFAALVVDGVVCAVEFAAVVDGAAAVFSACVVVVLVGAELLVPAAEVAAVDAGLA